MAAQSIPSAWPGSNLFLELQQRLEQQIHQASLNVSVTPEPCGHTVAFSYFLNQFNKLMEADSPSASVSSREVLEHSGNPIRCFCGGSVSKISLAARQQFASLPNDPAQVSSHVLQGEIAHQKVAVQLRHMERMLDHCTNARPMTPEHFRQSLTSLFDLPIEAYATSEAYPTSENRIVDLEAQTTVAPQEEPSDSDESGSIDPEDLEVEQNEEALEMGDVPFCDRPICTHNFVVFNRNIRCGSTVKGGVVIFCAVMAAVILYAAIFGCILTDRRCR